MTLRRVERILAAVVLCMSLTVTDAQGPCCRFRQQPCHQQAYAVRYFQRPVYLVPLRRVQPVQYVYAVPVFYPRPEPRPFYVVGPPPPWYYRHVQERGPTSQPPVPPSYPLPEWDRYAYARLPPLSPSPPAPAPPASGYAAPPYAQPPSPPYPQPPSPPSPSPALQPYNGYTGPSFPPAALPAGYPLPPYSPPPQAQPGSYAVPPFPPAPPPQQQPLPVGGYAASSFAPPPPFPSLSLPQEILVSLTPPTTTSISTPDPPTPPPSSAAIEVSPATEPPPLQITTDFLQQSPPNPPQLPADKIPPQPPPDRTPQPIQGVAPSITAFESFHQLQKQTTPAPPDWARVLTVSTIGFPVIVTDSPIVDGTPPVDPPPFPPTLLRRRLKI